MVVSLKKLVYLLIYLFILFFFFFGGGGGGWGGEGCGWGHDCLSLELNIYKTCSKNLLENNL